MSKLKKCPECKKYTLKESCSKCKKETKDAHYKFVRTKNSTKSSD
ncbi:MAG: hypothetical protein KKC19_03305 [Nanoarchaeota archaeon]|nr:hypothetical protein [Nanoarchaeota archaeon]